MLNGNTHTQTHRGRHRQICILLVDRRGKWQGTGNGAGTEALFWASALPKPNPPLEVFILFAIVVVVVVASLKCFQFKFSEQNAF